MSSSTRPTPPRSPTPQDAPAPPAAPVASSEPASTLDQLLVRSDVERLREFRYRFAQATVFGLPVIALQLFGYRLGGSDAARWVGLFQALLSGWVLYVSAAGLLFEGTVLLTRRKLTASFLVCLAAVALYGNSLVGWLSTLQRPAPRPAMQFHWVVSLLMLWTALRGLLLAQRIRKCPPDPAP